MQLKFHGYNLKCNWSVLPKRRRAWLTISGRSLTWLPQGPERKVVKFKSSIKKRLCSVQSPSKQAQIIKHIQMCSAVNFWTNSNIKWSILAVVQKHRTSFQHCVPKIKTRNEKNLGLVVLQDHQAHQNLPCISAAPPLWTNYVIKFRGFLGLS